MRKLVPRPFTFKAGKRAVLLLHGFTGNSADVRMLGRFLEGKGYSSHAPIFKGHGVPPEELIHTGPDDWWQDAVNGYEFLKNEGYEEIAVAGLSLGGVLSLKLGYTVPLKGIVPMCAPMHLKTEELMYRGVLEYAKEYKRMEGKPEEQIEAEVKELEQKSMATLKDLQGLIKEVRGSIDLIYTPTFVVQARHDIIIDPDSANIIYNQVESEHKELKWYEESGHVITLDKERDQLHEDVYAFLETLNWKE
ncbi:MAG TPA: carboxylesterase [Bacillus bacterium]|nr:carboxylesterase [Bacillus sp. (in: firmicutes)]